MAEENPQAVKEEVLGKIKNAISQLKSKKIKYFSFVWIQKVEQWHPSQPSMNMQRY